MGRCSDFQYASYPHICIVFLLSTFPTRGAFFTIDAPTPTDHYHPKSIVCISHSWCCPFYGFGQMYNDKYSSLWYYTGCFSCLKNPLCFTCSPLLPPKDMATTDCFTVPIILPFPECHIQLILE